MMTTGSTPTRLEVDPLLLTVLPAMQLSEKLDAVRERAGTVLERLMQSDDPQLPFIPERRAVKHAMREAEELGSMAPKEAINWASPAATFPIVVGLLAVSEYHDAIGEPGVDALPFGRNVPGGGFRTLTCSFLRVTASS